MNVSVIVSVEQNRMKFYMTKGQKEEGVKTGITEIVLF